MARVHVTRRIAADPTSTALLLSAPTALDLCPGVRRLGDERGRVRIEMQLPAPALDADATGATAEAVVRALPPRRTPTAFVTRFEFAGEGVPDTTGELMLAYDPAATSPATFAELRLEYVPAVGVGAQLSGIRAGVVLRGMAERFLANLAAAAEERSRAA